MPPKRIDPGKVKYFEDRTAYLLRKCKEDEKSDFVMKTFLEVNKDGWPVCTNGKIATCLETMMPFAPAEAIGCILKAFVKEMESVFNTKFAHHVLHAAVRQCSLQPDLRTDELIASCLNDYLEFMWENYPTFLQHPHAAPALRTYLQLLSGVSVSKSQHTGIYDADTITLHDPIDPNYMDRITDFANKFLLSTEFNTFVVDAITSPFLQMLLIICSKRMEEDFQGICSHILKKSNLLKLEDSESTGDNVLLLQGGLTNLLPLGFVNPVATFFLETLISLLPGSLLRKFITRRLLFSSDDEGGQVSLASALAGHSNACRILRAAIRAIKKTQDLQAILSALAKAAPIPTSPREDGEADSLPGLVLALRRQQHYLLTTLAKACREQTDEAVQYTFEKMVLEAFGFPIKVKKNDSQLIKAIISLTASGEGGIADEASKSENANSSDNLPSSSSSHLPPVKLAGCLLAEEMLEFGYHRPTRLAASLAALSPHELTAWSRNQMLHRVVETALQSKSVPAERKLQIFAAIKPSLGQISMDASGSRVVEALWRSTDAMPAETTGRATKEEIAQILAPLSDRLAASKFGRFVENLVSSAAYKANPDRWRNAKLGLQNGMKRGGSDRRPTNHQKGQTRVKRQKTS